jgi:hypothetical protein
MRYHVWQTYITECRVATQCSGSACRVRFGVRERSGDLYFLWLSARLIHETAVSPTDASAPAVDLSPYCSYVPGKAFSNERALLMHIPQHALRSIIIRYYNVFTAPVCSRVESPWSFWRACYHAI